MQIKESRESEIQVLGPVGHLDTRTQGDFEKVVLERLQAGERRFVVDMVEVEYLASAGLRVLLMLAKKLKATDGQLVICGMNEHVLEVFNVAGFSGFFTIKDTKEEALSTMGSVSDIDPAAMKVANLTARLFETTRREGEEVVQPTEDAVAVAKRVAAIFGVSQAAPPNAAPKPKPEPTPVVGEAAAEPAPVPPSARPEPAKPAIPVPPAEETVKATPLQDEKKGCLGALMFWKS